MVPESRPSPRDRPALVVLSSLFPSEAQTGAGLFVRERMFRVAKVLPLSVVSPRAWFPGQRFLSRMGFGSRASTAAVEQQQETVWFPKFVSVPKLFRRMDAWMMALGAFSRLKALQRAGRLDVLDAHFGYPDGAAAVRLGRWLKVPVCITMRGTELRHAQDPALAPQLREALCQAQQVFSVSESLRQLALGLGAQPDKVKVVGNGVDLQRFQMLDKTLQRSRLGLAANVRVLITVGGLVERKGFHRVIECLPSLLKHFPGLTYLIVGGPSPEGDWTDKLKAQVQSLGLTEQVRFLGPVKPDDLAGLLSAADLFVLSTSNEGWANVFLEAMACGLPVVTTDVGGNSEVVNHDSLGEVVAFGDHERLCSAIERGLRRDWDRQAIQAYAQDNTWDRRVEVLVQEFRRIHSQGRGTFEDSSP